MNDDKTMKADHDALPVIQPASSHKVKKKQKIEPAGTIVKVFVVLVFLLCGAGVVIDMSLKQGFNPVMFVAWMAGGFILSCLVGGVPAFIVFLCTKPKQDPALWTYCGVAGAMALIILSGVAMDALEIELPSRSQANSYNSPQTQAALNEIGQRHKEILAKEMAGESDIEASAKMIDELAEIIENAEGQYSIEIAAAIRQYGQETIELRQGYEAALEELFATGWPEYTMFENDRIALDDLCQKINFVQKHAMPFNQQVYAQTKEIADILSRRGVPQNDARLLASYIGNHPNNIDVRSIRKHDEKVIEQWKIMAEILRDECGRWTVGANGIVMFDNESAVQPFQEAYEIAVLSAQEQVRLQQQMINRQ